MSSRIFRRSWKKSRGKYNFVHFVHFFYLQSNANCNWKTRVQVCVCMTLSSVLECLYTFQSGDIHTRRMLRLKLLSNPHSKTWRYSPARVRLDKGDKSEKISLAIIEGSKYMSRFVQIRLDQLNCITCIFPFCNV